MKLLRWGCITLLALVCSVSHRFSLHAQPRTPTDPAVIDSLLSLGDTLLSPPTNMIVLNPGGIAADYIMLSYYHAFDRWNGVGAFVGYTYRPIANATVVGEFVGLAWRHHPGARALWRFHYGPMVSYHSFQFRDSNLTASGVALGGMVGWQWFPEGGFAAGVALGAQYVFGGNDMASPVMERMFGFRPLVAFDIGYAWGVREQSEE